MVSEAERKIHEGRRGERMEGYKMRKRAGDRANDLHQVECVGCADVRKNKNNAAIVSQTVHIRQAGHFQARNENAE
jgi:hypothetical protein